MKKIVIIGAGFAGLRLLYRLSRALRGEAAVTIVDKSEFSIEKPSLPEVAFAGKEVSKVRIPISRAAKRKGAEFLREAVVRIEPEKNHVITESGRKVEYDILAITTGAVKDYDSISGFRNYGFSICDDIEADRLSKRLESFAGGNVVIGSARTTWDEKSTSIRLDAPCEGPIGEVMFMIDSYLRERGIREKSSITVFTPGKVFFDDVGESIHQELAPMIKDHGISVLNEKVIDSISKDHVHFADGTSIRSDLSIIIPPYRGPDVIINSELGDSRGFIKTDRNMRHGRFPNIFVAGDVNADSMPKLGHIAIMQADVAAAAIEREVTGKGNVPAPSPEIFCIMNRGDSGATVILSDILYGGKRDIAYSGKLASTFKWGFDSYYFYTHGHMPPEALQEPVEFFIKLMRTNR
ncbi:MAG: FAD-dependent oxidoreductase [Candidatus Thermoplasmatota archaeon]|nr:FAD-dependent oxidoreductase [Candidatus Thermoplasmatota archaeon]MCL5731668.1 FAD-dependent oxidoreductase [Candidatus Thermoplasmatota archaeon]